MPLCQGERRTVQVKSVSMGISLENFYVVIGAERVNLKLDDGDKHRPQSKQLFVFVGGCVCVSVGGWGCLFSLRVRLGLNPPTTLLLLDLPQSLEYYLLT